MIQSDEGHRRPPPPAWTGENLDGLTQINQGKVRDIYDLGEHLLLVTTDRVSAYDVILHQGIPRKGCVLTQISRFWFDFLRENTSQPHHLLSTEFEAMPQEVKAHWDVLQGRSSLVLKAKPLPIEFVVRGYLAGSGWAEYQQTRSICGLSLPEGLRESDRLPEPILTPATKAEEGHDENIPFSQVVETIGQPLAHQASEAALSLYRAARSHAESCGVLLADTKLEFGVLDDQLILIDEAFTPDSSRFWPKDDYEPGRPQVSFDKQYVRDFLLSTGWDRHPPPPDLTPEIVSQTTQRYVEIYERLTGQKLPMN